MSKYVISILIIIGILVAWNVSVAIKFDYANDKITVGTLAVTTATINSAFTFPIVDGTSNQVLQTDGSGNLSWVVDDDVPESGDFGNLTAGTNISWSPAGTLNVDDAFLVNDANDTTTGTLTANSYELGDGDYVGISSTAERVVFDSTNGDISLIGGKVGIGDSSPDAILEVVSDASSDYFYITNLTDGDVLKVEGDGDLVSYHLDSIGNLTLNKSAAGNVTLFGATDVGDAIIGRSLYVYRKAAEGNHYLRFYVTAGEVPTISSDTAIDFDVGLSSSYLTTDGLMAVGSDLTVTGTTQISAGDSTTPSLYGAGGTSNGIAIPSNINFIIDNGTIMEIGGSDPQVDITGQMDASSDVISGDQFLGTNGAVGTPAYAFSSYADTGLYVTQPEDYDILHIAVSGTNRFDVDDSFYFYDNSGNQYAIIGGDAVGITTSRFINTSLIGYWQYGTDADDSSKYSNDGTLAGNAAVTGGYYEGDGTNGCYMSFSTTNMSTTQGTIMAWVNTDTTAAGSDYAMGHYNSGNRIYMLRNGASFNIRLGSSSAVDTGDDFSASTWYHIALTWDSGTYYAYWNGEQTATGSYTGLSSLVATAAVGNYAASTSSTLNWDGKIDNAKVYDRALQDYEIRRMYNDEKNLIP